MRKYLLMMLVATSMLPACSTTRTACGPCEGTEAQTAKPMKEPLACKLTTPELQERKRTVIAALAKQIQEKRELPDGYAFRFIATDEMLDTLTDFIKTERVCCSFFTFKVLVTADNKAWLEITGEEGVKEFISSELGM